MQPFEDLQQQWYGFFKKNSFFTYNRCSACGMLYSPHYFTESQLARLYASMPPNMVEVSDGALERTQLGYFRELQKFSKLEGEFLEIGPDVGMFAEACVRYGRFTKFWMFEPNADAHAELRRRIGGAELYVSTHLLDLSDVPAAGIDAVAMIHVLDHILDPVGFLAELRPKLKPGATLLIVTHDESSLLARLTRSRFPAYCLQHPHLFNPQSMRALLAKAGYGVVETKRSVNQFPVTFLIKHAVFALGLGKIRLPKLLWLRVPLRLGNFITIARPS
ncbi:MAG: class I SAM-dependent methyltransferase [Candidatus Eremiobacteraeota bacterium]|nr:class I SAM-dependent methyltransferase [Candidatus Eremiobacteraeota bacterium]